MVNKNSNIIKKKLEKSSKSLTFLTTTTTTTTGERQSNRNEGRHQHKTRRTIYRFIGRGIGGYYGEITG